MRVSLFQTLASRTLSASLLCVASLAAAEARAQAPAIPEAAKLRIAAITVEIAAASNGGSLLAEAQRTRQSIHRYLVWLDSQDLGPSDRATMGGALGIYVVALDDLSKSLADPAARTFLAKVDSDFSLRYQLVTQNLGAVNASPFVKVNLSAKVTGTNQQLTSAEAGFVMEGMVDRGARYRVKFPQLTPISEYKILPGGYQFFVERGGHVLGTRVVEVGFSGTPVETIEIPIEQSALR